MYAAWFVQQKVINIIESLQMEFPKKVTTTRATEKHQVNTEELINIKAKVLKWGENEADSKSCFWSSYLWVIEIPKL